MKKIILILTVTALFSACKNNQVSNEKMSYVVATIGSAAMHEVIPVQVQQAPAQISQQGNYTTTSTNAAKKKKGMSKAAKGAIIGGTTGAVTGAIITKSGKGAIIGGVLGAGTGYIIGRKKDKKDGRVQ